MPGDDFRLRRRGGGRNLGRGGSDSGYTGVPGPDFGLDDGLMSVEDGSMASQLHLTRAHPEHVRYPDQVVIDGPVESIMPDEMNEVGTPAYEKPAPIIHQPHPAHHHQPPQTGITMEEAFNRHIQSQNQGTSITHHPSTPRSTTQPAYLGQATPPRLNNQTLAQAGLGQLPDHPQFQQDSKIFFKLPPRLDELVPSDLIKRIVELERLRTAEEERRHQLVDLPVDLETGYVYPETGYMDPTTGAYYPNMINLPCPSERLIERSATSRHSIPLLPPVSLGRGDDFQAGVDRLLRRFAYVSPGGSVVAELPNAAERARVHEEVSFFGQLPQRAWYWEPLFRNTARCVNPCQRRLWILAATMGEVSQVLRHASYGPPWTTLMRDLGRTFFLRYHTPLTTHMLVAWIDVTVAWRVHAGVYCEMP
jgi:hypothetical protein